MSTYFNATLLTDFAKTLDRRLYVVLDAYRHIEGYIEEFDEAALLPYAFLSIDDGYDPETGEDEYYVECVSDDDAKYSARYGEDHYYYFEQYDGQIDYHAMYWRQ